MQRSVITRLLPAVFLFFFSVALHAQNTTINVVINGPTSFCIYDCPTYVAGSIVTDPNNPGGALPVPIGWEWSLTGPNGLVFTVFDQDSVVNFCEFGLQFSTPGYYILYVAVSFSDGQIVTESLTFFVTEYINYEILSTATACNFDSTQQATFCEKVCPGATVTYYLNQPVGVNGAVFWSVTGAQSYQISPDGASVTVTWGTPGGGGVSMYTSGGGTQGCAGEDYACVTVIESPQAQIAATPAPAGNQVTICKGQTVYFNNTSLNAEYYEWNFGDGSATVTAENPDHTYANAGTYTVQLVAISSCLCNDTTTLEVVVLDAFSLEMDCSGTVCAGETVTYTTSGSCAAFDWNVSANGTIVSGGSLNDNSITVQWGSGPVGTINLLPVGCTGYTCPEPTITRIPVIDDLAEIEGEDRACPGSTEVYAIESFGGTNFVWSLSGGGTIKAGQGTNRISIEWTAYPSSAQTYWVSVQYDNCYLECGGRDSLAVRVLSPFQITGPVEGCEATTGAFSTVLEYGGSQVTANWTLQGPTGAVTWNSATATANVNAPYNAGSGFYQLFATPTNPLLTCSDQANWAVRVASEPDPLTGIAGPIDICPGTVMTYEVNGAQAENSIRWLVTNGPGAPSMQSGIPLNVAWGANPPYGLQAWQVSTDGLQCKSDTAALTAAPIGPFTILGNPALCEGETGTYVAPTFQNLDIQWVVSPADAGTIVQGQGGSVIEVFWNEPGGHALLATVCGQTATFPITVWAKPTPVVVAPAGVCPGETALVTTATPFSTWRWKDDTGAILSVSSTASLGPGSYLVEVTDGTGCGDHTEFTIDEYPDPILSISTAQPTGFCNNSETILIRALTTDGAEYTYAWQHNGAPFGGNTVSIASNQYGLYTCTATNQYGCTAVAGPISLVEDCSGTCAGNCQGGGQHPQCPPGAIEIDVLPTLRCDSIEFAITGAYVAGTEQWTFGLSGGAAVATSVSATPTVVFPEAAQYIAVLTVALPNHALCTVYDSAFVWAKAKFDPVIDCPGLPTQFTDASAHLPQMAITDWAWNFGDPASGVNNTSIIDDASHTYSTAGLYDVVLTVTSFSGCTSTAEMSIEIPPVPAPVFSPTNNACPGNATELALDPDATITGVDWNFGDPASGAANQAEGGTVYHNFANTGAYTITAIAENIFGCSRSISQSVTITPNPLSGNISPAAPSALCEGATVNLTAPGANAVAWLWSTGATTQTITVGEEGVYGVTLTASNGCTYSPPDVNIEILPAPDALVKALLTNDLGQVIGTEYPNLSACFGEDVWLQASGSGVYNYSWSGALGTSVNQQFTEDRGNLLNVGTYIYTVTVTDASSGCTSVTDPFTVTIDPLPTYFSVSVAGGSCAGGSTTLAYLGTTPPAGSTYYWSNGANTPAITTGEAGTYILQVTNTYGCTNTASALILPGPPAQALPSGCHERCNPDTLCLPPLPSVTSMQWYLDGNPIAGGTGAQLIANQSGTYQAVLTDWYGCTAESDPLTLNLYNGFGNVAGQVWSDVNNNGIVDAADTLVSGVGVNLLQNAVVLNHFLTSGGTVQFQNIPSSQVYQIEIDPSTLGGDWQIVIGDAPVNLIGCGDTELGRLLIRYECSIAQTVNLSACAGEFAAYNGVNILAGQSQTFAFTTPSGCDSTIMVQVAALPASSASLSFQACPGDSYTYEGVAILAGQTQQVVLTNYIGCDSTVTVSVTPYPTAASTLQAKVCPGDTYTYQGTPLAAGQSQTFTLTHPTTGCDSMVTVQVTAYPAASSLIQATVCSGDTYTYQGVSILAGQSQTFTLTHPTTGCDSMVTVQVAAYPVVQTALHARACQGSTFAYNGVTLSPGQTQTFTLTHPTTGCDSLVVVDVTAAPVYDIDQTVNICPGTTYAYNGVEMQPGETRTFQFSTFELCDSTVTISVVEWPTPDFDINVQRSCPNTGTGGIEIVNFNGGTPPFEVSLDGTTFQAAPLTFDDLSGGAYTVWVQDANDCLFMIDTFVSTSQPLTVLLTDGVLPCDNSGVLLTTVVGGDTTALAYQWHTGATTPTLWVDAAGPVTLTVSNQCETLTRSSEVVWADAGTQWTDVYVPNAIAPQSVEPDNGLFRPYFAAGMEVRNYKLEVFDRWGDKLFESADPQDGWRGPFRQRNMQPGVYVWWLQADLDFCGRQIKIRKKGDVTIVR